MMTFAIIQVLLHQEEILKKTSPDTTGYSS